MSRARSLRHEADDLSLRVSLRMASEMLWQAKRVTNSPLGARCCIDLLCGALPPVLSLSRCFILTRGSGNPYYSLSKL